MLHRLFFALLPPPALARRMARAVAGLDCQPLPPARLHMPMFILDDRERLDHALLATMTAVGEALRAAPVAVTLDRLAGSYRSVALRPARADPALLALPRDLARHAAARGSPAAPVTASPRT